MTEAERKARACEIAGRLLARYMESGPFKFAAFVQYPRAVVGPLGIRALRGFPVEWFDEVRIPGYVIERVGAYGVRIF